VGSSHSSSRHRRPHTRRGLIRCHRRFPSVFARHRRDVLVYLPPGYRQARDRRYPVLYFQDGQNVFDAATSFAGVEWEVDETAERLVRAGAMAPLIVVAVANTPDRVAEYTPVPDSARGGIGGGAETYARFLIQELKPFIDARYRTLTGPESTGIAGSSLGGLAALYLGWAHPGTFSRLGLVSPSVSWAEQSIVRFIRQMPRPEARIWLDIGTAEGSSPGMARQVVGSVRALRRTLLHQGFILGKDLAYHEVSGAGHHEGAWAARVDPMLRFLFPPPSGVRAPR
jgi:predicted alpha/beta superfamily hydrolase